MTEQTEKPLTAKVVGERINAYLKRFEDDAVINAPVPRGGTNLTPFFVAQAYGERKYVYITYRSFQGQSKLTVDEARQYLDWLDAGNVGTHRQALKAN
jgi:hypothetical protein